MYTKILVPLDSSDVAECVLPYVEAIATANNEVDVTFLHIILPLEVPLTTLDFKARIESEAKSAAKNYLANVISSVKYKETTHSEVIVGKAADTIVDYAAQNKVDLIIMATHGLSGVTRWIHGSVADKVLHESEIPVWLIRADASQKAAFNEEGKIKILVPLDGSDLAEAILGHVKEMAKQFGPELVDITLLRVCELFSPPYNYPPPTPLSWEEYLDYETNRCKDICQTYLDKVEEQLKKDVNVQLAIPAGNPADTIVDYANSNDINLIAMSTHGRTGLSRWTLGSVAEKVLKGASCPIFLVRSSDSHGK